ncbi:hypothetical protein EYF80_008123 [Liparis tanakae]|uniref:Uncharacterized protein n=1 Tax=Liparis tanakae TaxID=230148 RepID=A0A4Z2IVA9_9TELE|nr:hypothetical protein EYF80_008123 [Liparis tanakae]
MNHWCTTQPGACCEERKKGGEFRRWLPAELRERADAQRASVTIEPSYWPSRGGEDRVTAWSGGGGGVDIGSLTPPRHD